MSWDTRLLKTVNLFSPSGVQFIGKWRQSTDPWTKSIAQFKTVAGNFGRVQDLGVDMRTSSFTVYFDGDDCDIVSEAFMDALAESGPWTVYHPVRGRLENQYPSSFEPTHDPMTSGGIVAINTSWITDYPDGLPESQIQRASRISDLVRQINEEEGKTFFEKIQTAAANLRKKVADVVSRIQSAIDNTLGPLIDTVEAGTETMNAIRTGITSTLDQVVLQTRELASEVQSFCQAPAEILQETNGKLAAFDGAIIAILGEELGGTIIEKRNQAFSVELGLLSTIAGYAQAFISNDIQTRPQAVEAVAAYRAAFESATNKLDSFSEEFADELTYEKYFSQSSTFELLSELVAAVEQYTLSSAVRLKAEKVITIENPQPAVFLSLIYYPELSVSDGLDLLVDTNNLTLDEIVLIPAGRRLVVYV